MIKVKTTNGEHIVGAEPEHLFEQEEMSGSKLPEFENPPVVETVLGAQFDPITGLQNAHLGLFWQFLQKEWPDGGWTEIDEIPPLEQQAEVFKEKQNWANMGLQLRLTENPANRLRIKNVAQDRMIQIQNGRLHFNWLGGGEYPRYHKVKPEFEKTLEIFKRFLKATFKEEPRFNQWEVTYVNHIPKGELWSDPGDWYKVVNIVPKPAPIEAPLKFDAIASNWQFTIEPELGRLYVQLNHAFLHDKNTEVLLMKLTARGPIQDGMEENLIGGLDLGRKTIITTFRDLTSESAHEYWRIKR